MHKFNIAFTFFCLAAEASLTALPCLVAKKFGVANALVISLVVRLLPRVVCAPFVGNLLTRHGAKRTAQLALLGMVIITSVLPNTSDYTLFQGLNLCLGTLSMAAIASLATMRGQVVSGQSNIKFNANLAIIERISRVVAPSFVGLLIYLYPFHYTFYKISFFFFLVALLLSLIKVKVDSKSNSSASGSISLSYKELLKIFEEKPTLWAIFIPLLGYGLMVGALPSFLFFLTTNILHHDAEQWSILLVAYGGGGIIGSLFAPRVINKMAKRINLLTIYLVMRLCSVIILLTPVWASTVTMAVIIMALAGIPDVTVSVCFFTLLQKRLSRKQEGIFHILSIPIFNVSTTLGGSCMGFYTLNYLSLRQLWSLLIGVALLAILSCLKYQRTISE